MISLILSAFLLAAAHAQSPAASTTTATATAAAPVPLRLLSEAELPRFDDSFKSHAGLIKAAKNRSSISRNKPGAFASPTGTMRREY